ncbi:hypothetical protein HAX54_024487 [Datura stramonium]|uniref:Uncharacterized protein n=1 Tax=Datura stramonium TaxID=4076 RepID=A0ABS8V098_DATST|nr:hypothetical protein [Datura stramonium]
MEMEDHLKSRTLNKRKCFSARFISILMFFLLVPGYHPYPYPLYIHPLFSSLYQQLSQENYYHVIETMTLKDSCHLPPPITDLSFRETATSGHTWFMNTSMYFPSKASKGHLLCFKDGDIRDGTENSYTLAWQGSLPDSAILLEGLAFVSDAYYNHKNLWHVRNMCNGSSCQMKQENKLKVFDLLRCKARSYRGLNPAGKGREINERGFPVIRLNTSAEKRFPLVQECNCCD